VNGKILNYCVLTNVIESRKSTEDRNEPNEIPLKVNTSELEGVNFEMGDLLLQKYGINIWPNALPLNPSKSASSWSSYVEDNMDEYFE
jgi:hypothetical protein